MRCSFGLPQPSRSAADGPLSDPLRVTVAVRTYRSCPLLMARGWHGRRKRPRFAPGGNGYQLAPDGEAIPGTHHLVGKSPKGLRQQGGHLAARHAALRPGMRNAPRR